MLLTSYNQTIKRIKNLYITRCRSPRSTSIPLHFPAMPSSIYSHRFSLKKSVHNYLTLLNIDKFLRMNFYDTPINWKLNKLNTSKCWYRVQFQSYENFPIFQLKKDSGKDKKIKVFTRRDTLRMIPSCETYS